ncbi:hypothetical protein VPHD479_0357 [Vibrio phage D479]
MIDCQFVQRLLRLVNVTLNVVAFLIRSRLSHTLRCVVAQFKRIFLSILVIQVTFRFH